MEYIFFTLSLSFTQFVVSYPDDLLFVEWKRCSSKASILPSWREIGDERKIMPLSYNFI